MAFGRGPSIVKDGLVVYLDSTNIKSYSGSGNIWNSLISNTSLSLLNGVILEDNFIRFDGINDYGIFNNAYSFTTGNGTDYTFEIWFKMRELPTSQYGPNSHIWGGENGNNVVIYLNPASNGVSKGLMVYDDTRYDPSMLTNGVFQVDTWSQWVITGNGTNNTITHYINGELDRGPTLVEPSSQHIRSWSGARIGYDSRWAKYSKLDLSIARQYNRELSDIEVQKNFNATKSRYGL